jgi:hypothetical protein
MAVLDKMSSDTMHRIVALSGNLAAAHFMGIENESTALMRRLYRSEMQDMMRTSFMIASDAMAAARKARVMVKE